MRRMKYLMLAGLMAVSATVFPSCDAAEELCGPCGEVTKGDAFISGDARIDGIFAAVGSFGKATAQIDTSFKADVMALGELFGADITADMEIGDMVAEVKAAINAELSASVDGGLSIQYEPPKCSASVEVAVEAQANCEASAGCDVECDPGELEVSCTGECSGGCSGECTGALPKCSAELSASGVCEAECSGSCELQGPALTCEGTCTGGCEASVSGECSGTCKGTCSGTCSATDGSGNCAGECSGTCEGTCEVQVDAKCDGECNGKCEFTPPSGQCEGTCKGECNVEVEAGASCEGGEAPKCEGTCEGSCSAECSGKIEPPSCSADCEASADCQASASANASASVECTPPSLEIAFELNANLDAKAQAEFKAKMAEFKVRMMAVIQGMFKMRALVDADYAASIGIESPMVQISGLVEGLISADLDSFDIPVGRFACVLPALETSADILLSAGTDMVATFQAQFEMVAVLDIM